MLIEAEDSLCIDLLWPGTVAVVAAVTSSAVGADEVACAVSFAAD